MDKSFCLGLLHRVRFKLSGGFLISSVVPVTFVELMRRGPLTSGYLIELGSGFQLLTAAPVNCPSLFMSSLVEPR